MYTGNPVFTNSRAYSGGLVTPNLAKITQIYASIYPTQHKVHSPQQYGLNSTWGSASNVGLPSTVYWISQHKVTATDYTVHRLPCGAVVKPGLVVGPYPGPTRPQLPNFPKPVDVKGDHFSYYLIEKSERLKAEQIQITDQFGTAKAVLGMPKVICNPSIKIHRRQTFGIENQKRHLVCYEILEQSPNRNYELEIHTQFEKRRIRSTNRELFCVPSLKKHL